MQSILNKEEIEQLPSIYIYFILMHYSYPTPDHSLLSTRRVSRLFFGLPGVMVCACGLNSHNVLVYHIIQGLFE